MSFLICFKVLNKGMAQPLSDGGLNDENQIIGVFFLRIVKEMSLINFNKKCTEITFCEWYITASITHTVTKWKPP
jgi:hypothetical protein